MRASFISPLVRRYRWAGRMSRTSAPIALTVVLPILSVICGDLAGADEFPDIPVKHLSALKAIPKNGRFAVEVGEPYGQSGTVPMKFSADIRIIDLARHQEYRWKLPDEVVDGLGANSLHRASWAPKTSQLLVAKLNEAFIISRDGAVSPLSLQMPGHLPSLQGIETYAMSLDGQSVVYYLYTRDTEERQPDGFGKLYVDLMVENLPNSPPVTIMRNTRPSALAWSPNGQEIAYGDYNGQLVVVTRSGEKLLTVQVPQEPAPAGGTIGYAEDLKWTPDGKWLGVLVFPARQLYVLDDKGDLRKRSIKSPDSTPKELTVDSFSWSPDGRKLVFRSPYEAPEICNRLASGYEFETGHFPCLSGSNLFVSNANGTDTFKITSDPDYSYGSQGELFWVQ